jgi:uncharacterized phage-like protein YoqJ
LVYQTTLLSLVCNVCDKWLSGEVNRYETKLSYPVLKRKSRMKIAITGHRPNKLNNEYGMKGPCSTYIRSEILKVLEKENNPVIISGMAIGVDQIFALMAIELNFKLIAAIPFVGQEKMWPQKSQDIYKQILEYKNIEKVIVCQGSYSPEKMQIRNKWMVDNCDKIIAVFDGTNGGTKNCVTYARSQKKEMIHIDPRKWLP